MLFRSAVMSGGKRQKKNARHSSVIGRVAKGLYIVLFVLSLIIVVSFVALNVFAPAPTVDSQVTFNPGPRGPDQTQPPADSSDQPEATPTPLVLMPKSGIVGSSSSTMSNFLRNCQTDFQSGNISLQSRQQWRSVLYF